MLELPNRRLCDGTCRTWDTGYVRPHVRPSARMSARPPACPPIRPSARMQVCPLRQVHPSDFSDRNQRKRFCDWKFVCQHFEKLLVSIGEPVMMSRDATILQVNRQFQLVYKLHTEQVKFLHPSKNKRRLLRTRPGSAIQALVSTVAKDIRYVRKAAEDMLQIVLYVQARWRYISIRTRSLYK